jgi:hypothetical protein
VAPVGAPDREIDAPLPACCPDCGGEVELERTAEPFQVDFPPMRPVTTKFDLGSAAARLWQADVGTARRADLGRPQCPWLDENGLAPGGLTTARALEFLDTRRLRGHRPLSTPRGLSPLLEYLVRLDAVPKPARSVPSVVR